MSIERSLIDDILEGLREGLGVPEVCLCCEGPAYRGESTISTYPAEDLPANFGPQTHKGLPFRICPHCARKGIAEALEIARAKIKAFVDNREIGHC